ncbi:MAG: carbohydrate kinase family protein [Patescibacteria group bacterium]
MFDIITVGHSTIDYFLKLREADVHLHEDGDSLLCVDFADKIPLESFEEYVGGNATNTAVGCARLGLDTAIVSWIGKDLEGEFVLKTLKEEGVDSMWIRISEEDSTDQSVILNFQGERTIFSYHPSRTPHLPENVPETKYVYLTSSGVDFQELHVQVAHYVGQVGAKLAYNPGTHELEAGVEKNRAVLECCQVLILNSEEAGELARGKFVDFEEDKRAQQIGELMQELRDAGPEIVAVTDGGLGSYVFDGKNIIFVPPVETEVVEMTGAGDSFSAGFLSALVRGKDLKTALKWGNTNAASVISQVGSQAGLLSREDLRSRDL